MTSHRWTDSERRYESVYRDRSAAQGLLDRIWGEVYGEEYLDAATLSFVTRTELGRVAAAMPQGGGLLLDLCCGAGGPGRLLGNRLQMRVIGVDVSPSALREARRSARSGDHYFCGNVSRLPLGSERADAAVCIDGAWMILQKDEFFAEVFRILTDGATLAMTTWEPVYESYRDRLETAGFVIGDIHEPHAWRERQLAVYGGVLDHAPQLIRFMGSESAGVLLAEAEEVSQRLVHQRRIVVTAHKVG
jgi:ubiquinone/menaquinone biosynthesis C-methylase UbiE